VEGVAGLVRRAFDSASAFFRQVSASLRGRARDALQPVAFERTQRRRRADNGADGDADCAGCQRI
jgi:hypothetical protein